MTKANILKNFLNIIKKIYGKNWSSKLVLRWIVIGFFFSFTPVIVSIIYDFILDYNFTQIFERNILDNFMCIFSIALNIFFAAFNLDFSYHHNEMTEEEEKSATKSRNTFIFLSLFLAVISMGIFSCLYDRIEKSLKIFIFFIILLHWAYFLGTNLEKKIEEFSEKEMEKSSDKEMEGSLDKEKEALSEKEVE